MRTRLMRAAFWSSARYNPSAQAPPLPRIKSTRFPSLRAMFPSSNNMDSARLHVQAGNVGQGALGVMEFLDSLKDYEKLGVPKGAGTESPEGFDLARMRRLLFALGDPLFCYPVIHVAGTKGKGSTATFVSNILRAQGYCVGSYTSPHIMSIHERIIAGKTEDPISPSSLESLFQDNRNIIEAAVLAEQGSLTYFEVLTALAFQYFATVNVDVAVVEAGLGGARDATNVISPSGLAVAVITNIGKEHLTALGGSLESIALAKSGIIKEGQPVVLGGPLDSRSEDILCEVATAKHSRVIRAFGEGMQYKVIDVKLRDEGAFQCCDLSVNSTSQDGSPKWEIHKKSLKLQMMGAHQLNNAFTAICTTLCLRDQGWEIHDNAIWSGLERTFTAGRFHIIPKTEAMRVGCNDSTTLVLDGAHTASSAKALASTLKMVFPSESLAFIVAMASDKDHYEFCSQLLSGAVPTVVVVTESLVAGGRFRSTPASLLAQTWDQAAKDQGLKVAHICSKDENKNSLPDPAIIITESNSILSSVKKARQLLDVADKKGVVCVCGSLHAVSEVLSFLRTESSTDA